MIIAKPICGDVYLVDLGPTIGGEQAKNRPCIVLSANTFNQGTSRLVIVVPLTTKNKNNPLHISVTPAEGGLKTESFALCDQIKSISLLHLSNRIGSVCERTLKSLEYALKTLLDFE